MPAATLWYDPNRKLFVKILRRRPNPLMGAWIGGVLLCGVTYWFTRQAPAFEDLVSPVYWIVGIILVAFTAKWLRGRHAGDRRGDDRRHTARRDKD